MAEAPATEHKTPTIPHSDNPVIVRRKNDQAAVERKSLISQVSKLVRQASLPSAKVRDFMKEAGDVEDFAHDPAKRTEYLDIVRGLIQAEYFNQATGKPLKFPRPQTEETKSPVKGIFARSPLECARFDASASTLCTVYGWPLDQRTQAYIRFLACAGAATPMKALESYQGTNFDDAYKQFGDGLANWKKTQPKPMPDFDNFDKPAQEGDTVGKPAAAKEKTEQKTEQPKKNRWAGFFKWYASECEARNVPNEPGDDGESERDHLRHEAAKILDGVDSFKDLSEGVGEDALKGAILRILKARYPVKPTKEQWEGWLESHKDYTAAYVLKALHADSLKRNQGPVTKLSEWDGELSDVLAAVLAYVPPEEDEAESDDASKTNGKAATGSGSNSGNSSSGSQNNGQGGQKSHGANGNGGGNGHRNQPPADTTTTAMTIAQTNALVANSPEMMQLEVARRKADVLLKSGLLPKSVDTVEKVMVITWMGDALGINQLVALNNINVIAGKPTVSPQLMLALVRRSKQLESFSWTDDGETSTVHMKRTGEPEHVETFSQADADALTTTEWVNHVAHTISLSQKKNWQEQPKTMRKWRAIAAACRVVFSDVTWGIASYTPEEIDADAEIIDAEIA